MAAPTPTGFDGLSSFSTDADAAIASAERILASPPPPRPASAQPGPPVAPVHSDGLAASGNTNTGCWITAIVVFVVCIFVAVGMNSDDNSYSDDVDSYETTEAPAEEALSADMGMEAAEAAGDEEVGDGTLESEAESPDSSIGEFDAGTAYGDIVDSGGETKPSPGYAPLAISEIRYCLAEEIRLNAQKSELESLKYSDPDRMNRNLDGFNAAIEEFNSLCGGRQFVASQRSIAEAGIGARRFTLQSEGRNRVQ